MNSEAQRFEAADNLLSKWLKATGNFSQKNQDYAHFLSDLESATFRHKTQNKTTQLNNKIKKKL